MNYFWLIYIYNVLSNFIALKRIQDCHSRVLLSSFCCDKWFRTQFELYFCRILLLTLLLLLAICLLFTGKQISLWFGCLKITWITFWMCYSIAIVSKHPSQQLFRIHFNRFVNYVKYVNNTSERERERERDDFKCLSKKEDEKKTRFNDRKQLLLLLLFFPA